ncbi:MAG: phosphatase PAP2 family protein [Comamonadaceae bacterium]|nr:MAG: phosphatase PAP2 family protein [Comamonadaceae bacterium]
MPADTSALVGIAQQVGARALPVFLVALAGLVLCAGIAGFLTHRRRLARDPARVAPASLRRLAAAFAGGFALILGAASLFATIAGRIDPGNAMGLADQALADAIAEHTSMATLRVFALVSHLGDPLVLTLIGGVVAIFLWRRGAPLLATGWVLALGGNAVLNPLLKGVFERVRPLHDHGLAVATGYSFPSGHSSGALVVYGMLLYVGLRLLAGRWHAALAMVATAMVFTIACSRIFLRVHFASDVAAGLLSGLCWTGVCIAGLEFARARARHAESQYSQKMR